eukprot:scaffold421342_cov60-Attheya_sp.AAC.2
METGGEMLGINQRKPDSRLGWKYGQHEGRGLQYQTNTSISLVPPARETLKIPTARGEASHNGMCVASIFDVNQS